MQFRSALLLTLPAICVVGLPGVAHAFPPGEKPVVSCTEIDIDPPTWVQVRFHGTIGGQAFDRTVFYGDDGTHHAFVGIEDLTVVPGPLAYDVTADGGYLGTAHAEGTITCHDLPTTTTTATVSSTSSTTASSSTTSSTVTPTTSVSSTTTSAPSEPPSTRLGPPVTARGPELPFTGASSGPLAVLGALCVGVGLALKGPRR